MQRGLRSSLGNFNLSRRKNSANTKVDKLLTSLQCSMSSNSFNKFRWADNTWMLCYIQNLERRFCTFFRLWGHSRRPALTFI